MKKIPNGEFWAKVISSKNTSHGSEGAIGKRYKFRINKDYNHLVHTGVALEYLEDSEGNTRSISMPNIVVSSNDVSFGNILNL